ncbi:MAG: peptidylprolyl isomerase [Prevotellaceae bacterium]|jgi:FKBP-type peptidyl-prolyl cis-trans isomerase SlyD|nr:peptidylprolyl isomerase [Prevotellaceae bacterium]
MQISKNKVVSISYQLTVDGSVIDEAATQKPFSFLFGGGLLLPKFEANIEGLRVGDPFKFTLTPAEGYGEFDEKAIQEFPLDTFMVDGKLEEDLLTEGADIPMQDSDGNIFNAFVVELKENSVALDFNHPLAGMELNFEGSIINVREATEKELARKSVGGCACGCDDGCRDDGDCCCDGDNDDCCDDSGSCECKRH